MSQRKEIVENRKVIFLQKSKESYVWTYMYQKNIYTVVAEGVFFEQLIQMIEHIRDTHDLHDEDDVVIFSTSFLKDMYKDLQAIFSGFTLIQVSEPSLYRLFPRAIKKRQNNETRKKGNTLFVCSDASRGITDVSSWAWISNEIEEPNSYNYNFSVNKDRNINMVEFEGLMRAIIDNGSKDYDNIHIYSDSKNSVDFAHEVLFGKTIPKQVACRADLMRLVSIAQKVSQSKNISIEWVRGHKNHRLNMGADYLSRQARIIAEKNSRLRHHDKHVSAMMTLFR